MLLKLNGFPVTNTVVTTLIVDCIIMLLIWSIKRKMQIMPNNFQIILEYSVVFFEDIIIKITNSRHRLHSIMPLIFAFFIFILINNFTAQLPGFDLMKFYQNRHSVHILKTATSDLNLTLALSLISVIATHYLSIKYIGIKKYLNKFINFQYFPIFMFVGLLEIFNEIAKLISFSFRLYGNMLAGEKVLTTIYSLAPLIIPIPFICLEFMVSVVQAVIFVILTIVFMHIFTYNHHN
ncbi:MAG: F0F1 ATP synthase subunit A [Endomicrobium sp.]|jgi:F-type H+-transporting ATPase subunit a|nr:F0F1 ATP synthase subunit A [Endomicrobium sp.]